MVSRPRRLHTLEEAMKRVHNMKMRPAQVSFFVTCICKYIRLIDISCYHKGVLPMPDTLSDLLDRKACVGVAGSSNGLGRQY
jgi:hypothetical protein